MVDPVSISVLGGVALSEGIKFLYGQVTDLLRRRHDRAEQPGGAPTLPGEQAGLLDGAIIPRPVDEQVVDAHQGQLQELADGLRNYATGRLNVDPADQQLRQRVVVLRALLELAYGQHLTFRGEQRPATGSPLPAEAPVEDQRYVANVNVSGAGAVGVGRDNTGGITATTHNPGPAATDQRLPRSDR